jgi:sugar/nucleoside kinase (ribokinase family)
MTIEVAVVGAPYFDLTFEGLPRVPTVGEELVARALHIAPGGSGMQAIGSARLGLSTALVALMGRGESARILRSIIESEGVAIAPEAGHPDAGVPTTALLSTPQGVAMATVLDGMEPERGDVAAVGAESVVISLGRLDAAPEGVPRYAITGSLEIDNAAAALDRTRGLRALILNHAEAAAITGSPVPADAAAELARSATTVVVTIGRDGAVGYENGRVTEAAAPYVDVVDATGAGDLFVAAYVWADRRGAPLEDRLAWATLYAGLSVRTPTALSGALFRDELLEAGRERGLAPPG